MIWRAEVSIVGGRVRVFALAVVILAVLAGFVTAQAEARVSAKVTIKPTASGYFGEVSSKAVKRCAAGRQVEVFLRRSGARKFRSIGKTRAHKVTRKIDPDRGKLRWKLATKAEGRFFARVAAKKRCRAAKSPVIKGLARGPKGTIVGDDIPSCPARGKTVCRFERLHLDAGLCPGYTKYAGTCAGSISGPSPWWTNAGYFHWSDRVGNFRTVEMWATMIDDMNLEKWRMNGSMSSPDKAEWPIEDAWNKGDGEPVLHWMAPMVEGQAGQLGGPLYLDFENGLVGADIYVDGYLYRK